MSEIIDRSLIHIQTSKALGMRLRIGEHELCGPDYWLVCALAEDVNLTPEEVIRRLLSGKSGYTGRDSRIEDGRFKVLCVNKETLPVSCIRFIEGLDVEILDLRLKEAPTGLDLSMFPNLTALYFSGNQLTELDLSQVSNLTELECDNNHLPELDLSHVPKLSRLICYGNPLTELDLSNLPGLMLLYCFGNQLTKLDLSHVPNLMSLYCFGNQLTELDLSQVPNLTELFCSGNHLTVLDIRNLRNLEILGYDKTKTRLIQRPDQKF